MSKRGRRNNIYSRELNTNFNIFAILVAIVLLVAPFNRGLFFDDEFFIATIFLAVVFGGFWLSRLLTEQTGIRTDAVSLSAWGLIGAYILSSFVAINLRGSIGEIIRWGTYLLVYYLVAYGSRNRKDLDFYLKVLYVTGLGLALAGLGTAFGSFTFNGAFEKETGRVLSTLQYANSLAVYLNTILIIGLFLVTGSSSKSLNKLWTPLYGAGNYLLLLAFIGTQSRGAWLVFPIVLIVYLLSQPKSMRLMPVIYIALTMVASFMLSSKVLNFTVVQKPEVYWLWLIAGAILAGALHLGLLLLMEKVGGRDLFQTSKRGLAITAGIVLLVVLGGGLLVAQKPELLPQRFVSRIASINLAQHSVQERFYFYQDAVKIIKDYPLLGTGGKGWEAIYQKYQSYLYLSNQVHSHFLQVWVESGIVGFGFFLAIWIAFYVSLFKARKTAKSAVDKSRLVTIGVAVLTLGMHSLIDFNLSLGAISLMLWCLFGLGRAAQLMENGEENSARKAKDQVSIMSSVTGYAALVLAVVLLIGSISLRTALDHGITAVEAMSRQDIAAAQKELEAAQSYDPFQATYKADYAQILIALGQQKQDKELLKRAEEYVDAAQRLNSGNIKIRLLKSRFLLSNGQIESGVREVEAALNLGPWLQDNYNSLSDVYFLVGQYYFTNGDQQKAKEYLRKAIGVSELLKQQAAKLTPETRKLWIRVPMLEVSPAMQEAAKKSSVYLAKL
ncbi:MAG: O-antigen ligase family protein [Carboxydocellales bacterium]